jgi:signal transduction histidine kinase
VQDYGPGIPAEDLSQVFSRYYRVERAEGPGGGGLGLGLFIAQEIVAAHGGRIEVRSQEGAGTTFAVLLPALTPAGAAEVGAGSRTTPGEAGAGGHDAKA